MLEVFKMIAGTASSPTKVKATFSSIHSAQSSTYDAFYQYEIKEVLIDAIPANHVVEAKSKVTGESCFLCLRYGEYSAQLDKAISDINRLFIPSTPVTWIVRNGNLFYLASKKIENTIEISDINDVESPFTPLNFGRVSVLTHFLGEFDRHQGNVLISNDSDSDDFECSKIDNAKSLHDACLLSAKMPNENSSDDDVYDMEPEFPVPELELKAFNAEATPESITTEDVLANHWDFPPTIINHFQYQREQAETLKTIASMPFSRFATILRNTVTASKRTEHLSFLEKLLGSDMIINQQVCKKIEAQLAKPETFPKVSEIEDSIALLEKRHQQYAALKPK